MARWTVPTFEVEASDRNSAVRRARSKVEEVIERYVPVPEPEPEPEPQPEPEPEPVGTLVASDPCTNPNPVPLWKKIESAYPQQDATNPQVRHMTEPDGTKCRELFLTNGKQSLADDQVGNDSYRTQLISNSDTDTFYPLQDGKRYRISMGVKFQSPTPLTSDARADSTQVWQVKNTGSGVWLILALVETKTNVRLGSNIDRNLEEYGVWPIARGRWVRFDWDVLFSSTTGKQRLWIDGVPVTNVVTGRRTAYSRGKVGKFSIGPYQDMSTPAVSRRYTKIEVREMPLDASWER